MPIRTCVGCRAAVDQHALVRLVVEPTGRVKIDRGRRRPGRGAYLHQSKACVDEAVHNRALQKSLRRKTQPVDARRLWATLTGNEDKDLEHE